MSTYAGRCELPKATLPRPLRDDDAKGRFAAFDGADRLRRRLLDASRMFPPSLVAAASLFAVPCQAHHSAAIFDMTRSVTLTGTVRRFEWINPHCWVQVLVPSDGRLEPGLTSSATEWSVEMGSPSQLYRNGWRPGTLRPGDSVTIIIHPAKDRMTAGEFVSGSGQKSAPIEYRAPVAHP